jgi:hypothetical protein
MIIGAVLDVAALQQENDSLRAQLTSSLASLANLTMVAVSVKVVVG